MIINTNPVTLKCGVVVNESVVIGHHFNGSTAIGQATAIMQTDFYLSAAKWAEDFTNILNVEGWTKKDSRIEFTYPFDSVNNIDYFFDLLLKDKLMQVFPTWDAEKLVITTEPAS